MTDKTMTLSEVFEKWVHNPICPSCYSSDGKRAECITCSREQQQFIADILALFRSLVPEERDPINCDCNSMDGAGCGCRIDDFNSCRQELLAKLENIEKGGE